MALEAKVEKNLEQKVYSKVFEETKSLENINTNIKVIPKYSLIEAHVQK